MKLYIWENVLADWTSGLVVVLAPDLKTARKIVREQVAPYGMEEFKAKPEVVDLLKCKKPKCWHVAGGG